MDKKSILAVLIAVIIVSPISTWVLMLVLGGVHSFIPVIPALGFWQTFLVSVLFNIIANKFKRVNSDL